MTIKRFRQLALSAFLIMSYGCNRSAQSTVSSFVDSTSDCSESQEQTTVTLAAVADRVRLLGRCFGSDHVLVVYDIDNTLLAMNQDLGSDQWFSWQEAELKKPQPNEALAADMGGLLKIQGTLFALSQMHSPEESAPQIAKDLEAEGFRSIALTSRGTDFRDFTERELARQGINFGTQANLPGTSLNDGYPGAYIPYDLDHPENSGLSAELVLRLNLGAARPTSFMNGIFMSGGQHKGAMLLTFLAKQKLGSSIRGIVFVDDQEKHTKRVQDALRDSGISVTTYRYSHEDARVKFFLDSDKSEVQQQWRRLENVLRDLFPPQFKNCGSNCR